MFPSEIEKVHGSHQNAFKCLLYNSFRYDIVYWLVKLYIQFNWIIKVHHAWKHNDQDSVIDRPMTPSTLIYCHPNTLQHTLIFCSQLPLLSFTAFVVTRLVNRPSYALLDNVLTQNNTHCSLPRHLTSKSPISAKREAIECNVPTLKYLRKALRWVCSTHSRLRLRPQIQAPHNIVTSTSDVYSFLNVPTPM